MRTRLSLWSLALLGLLLPLTSPASARAESIGNAITPVPIGNNPHPNDVINALYGKAFFILGIIGGALAVIYLMYAGIQYIQAGGDAAKAKAARGQIINAIIGIVIITAAYAFVRLGAALGGWLVNMLD